MFTQLYKTSCYFRALSVKPLEDHSSVVLKKRNSLNLSEDEIVPSKVAKMAPNSENQSEQLHGPQIPPPRSPVQFFINKFCEKNGCNQSSKSKQQWKEKFLKAKESRRNLYIEMAIKVGT